MGTETKTTKIGINDYSYTQLPARKSLTLKFTIVSLIGKSLIKGFSSVGKDEKEQMETFADAMTSIFDKNSPEKIISLIEEIFTPAFRNGERVNIDKHFEGGFSEMYSALFWVLKMEYGSFLEEAQSILK